MEVTHFYNDDAVQNRPAFTSIADSLKNFIQPQSTKSRSARRGFFHGQLLEGINRRQPFYVDVKGKSHQLKPLTFRGVACLTGHLNERKLEHLKDLCKETELNAKQGVKGYAGRTFAKEFFVRLQHDERFKKPKDFISTRKKRKLEKPATASLFDAI